MLVGLLADTHDNEPLVRVVASLFRAERVEMAFHLGDVCDPETLAPLEGIPTAVVRGNNDDERWPDSWQGQLGGALVGATHGHDRATLTRLVAECDVVLHGHTHARRREQVGRALVVNPGALYRTTTRSCALLELPSRRVMFYRVDEQGVTRL